MSHHSFLHHKILSPSAFSFTHLAKPHSGWSHLFSFFLPVFNIRVYQKPILPPVLWALSFPIFSVIFNLFHRLLNVPTSLSSYKESVTQALFPQLLPCLSPTLQNQTSWKTCLHLLISFSHLLLTPHPLQYDFHPHHSTKYCSPRSPKFPF